MMRFIRQAAFAVAALGASLVLADVRIQGAGATFPNPLYQRWVTEYQKSHPDVKIDYQSIGSGGGIKAITEKTVAFAGSDAPLSKKEQEAMGGGDKIVQIPTTAGGVVPVFNLPGIAELNFSGEVLADIYLGKVTKWNDPKLAALNAGAKLPDQIITPAWRTDGSGTTFVFTNYLATQSEDYKGSIGTGKSVKWPIGQGGKGNEGVTAVVQQTVGAIGYVEAAYAHQNHLAFGAVKNKSGKFVKASPETVSAAGAGAVEMMKGQVISADIWNQPGDEAYPIAAFTYLIVFKDLNNVKSKEEATALLSFLNWAIHGGQDYCKELDYAPLADGVKAKAAAALATVTWQGNAVTADAK